MLNYGVIYSIFNDQNPFESLEIEIWILFVICYLVLVIFLIQVLNNAWRHQIKFFTYLYGINNIHTSCDAAAWLYTRAADLDSRENYQGPVT